MRELRIEGLTEEQCMFLDVIHACESYDELMNFTHSLPRKEQLEVLTLIQILLHETIEEEMIKPMTSYPEAEQIINKIRKNLK